MIISIAHNICYNWMILHFIYNELYRLINLLNIANIKYASDFWSIWPRINCVHGVLNRSFVVSIMYYRTLKLYTYSLAIVLPIYVHVYIGTLVSLSIVIMRNIVWSLIILRKIFYVL